MAPILVREFTSEQNFCVEIVKEVQTSVQLCAEMSAIALLVLLWRLRDLTRL
jgi:hypothetical protein